MENRSEKRNKKIQVILEDVGSKSEFQIKTIAEHLIVEIVYFTENT